MHEIIKKISKAVQIVLMAPIKLPGKAINIIKYIALGLGIIESVLPEDKSKEESGPNSLREDTDTKEHEQRQHESK